MAITLIMIRELLSIIVWYQNYLTSVIKSIWLYLLTASVSNCTCCTLPSPLWLRRTRWVPFVADRVVTITDLSKVSCAPDTSIRDSHHRLLDTSVVTVTVTAEGRSRPTDGTREPNGRRTDDSDCCARSVTDAVLSGQSSARSLLTPTPPLVKSVTGTSRRRRISHERAGGATRLVFGWRHAFSLLTKDRPIEQDAFAPPRRGRWPLPCRVNVLRGFWVGSRVAIPRSPTSTVRGRRDRRPTALLAPSPPRQWPCVG